MVAARGQVLLLAAIPIVQDELAVSYLQASMHRRHA